MNFHVHAVHLNERFGVNGKTSLVFTLRVKRDERMKLSNGVKLQEIVGTIFVTASSDVLRNSLLDVYDFTEGKVTNRSP